MGLGRSVGSDGGAKALRFAGGFHPGGAQSGMRARGGSTTPGGRGGAPRSGAEVSVADGQGQGSMAGRSRERAERPASVSIWALARDAIANASIDADSSTARNE